MKKKKNLKNDLFGPQKIAKEVRRINFQHTAPVFH